MNRLVLEYCSVKGKVNIVWVKRGFGGDMNNVDFLAAVFPFERISDDFRDY